MRRLCKTVYMDLYSPAAGGMTARSAPARNTRAGGERIRLLRPAQSGETGRRGKAESSAPPAGSRLGRLPALRMRFRVTAQRGADIAGGKAAADEIAVGLVK